MVFSSCKLFFLKKKRVYLLKMLTQNIEKYPEAYIVITKDGCEYCEKTIHFLDSMKKKVIVFPQNAAVNGEFKTYFKSNYDVFPKIIHEKKFIGGLAEIKKKLLSPGKPKVFQRLNQPPPSWPSKKSYPVYDEKGRELRIVKTTRTNPPVFIMSDATEIYGQVPKRKQKGKVIKS